MSVINSEVRDSAVSLQSNRQDALYTPVSTLLDQREKVIETTKGRLLDLATLPLTATYPEEKSLRELKPLKAFTDEALIKGVRSEQLWDDRILPKMEKNSLDYQALVDPTYSSSPQARIAHSTVDKKIREALPRFKQAEEYLHPRDLVAQGSGKRNPELMPKMTKPCMEAILGGYSIKPQKVLGEGSQGKVSLIHVQGTPYVVKEWLPAGQEVKSLEQRANLFLATDDREPVVQAQAMTKNTMIMEHMPHGNFLSLFPDDPDEEWISEPVFIQAAKDMAQALNYVNQQGFYHADVKPENFMRTPSGVKLADFGCARENTDWGASGTLDYMAPELFTGKGRNSTEADVFSFGIIMYHYLTGMFPEDVEDLVTMLPSILQTTNEEQLLKNFRTCGAVFTRVITEKLKDAKAGFSEVDSTGELRKLALECLSIDPAKRPTFQAIEDRLATIE